MTNELKLEIVQTIKENPILTNTQVGEIHEVTAQVVSGTRTWFIKNPIKYENNLKLLILETEKRTALVNKLYVEKSNEFKNKGGKGKKEARQIMVNHINDAKTQKLNRGVIATLPSNTWAIEDLIHTQVSKMFSYLACERVEGVFIDMVTKLNQFGRKNVPFFGSLSEIILGAKEDQFDHIIADYCGVLSTFKNELIHACLNNIVKVGGTISVTTLKARNDTEFTSKMNGFYSETITGLKDSCSINLTDNHQAISMFFKSLSAITNFEVVEEFCYCDTAPMILVVLKRTK